ENRAPNGPKEYWAPKNTSENLGFATVPLTLGGAGGAKLMEGDRAAASDQADIQNDIPFIAKRGGASVNWRWYENGYGAAEPNEPAFAPTSAHAKYVSHHN